MRHCSISRINTINSQTGHQFLYLGHITEPGPILHTEQSYHLPDSPIGEPGNIVLIAIEVADDDISYYSIFSPLTDKEILK